MCCFLIYSVLATDPRIVLRIHLLLSIIISISLPEALHLMPFSLHLGLISDHFI